MSDAIIVAIVSGLFTLLGSFAGAMTSHNLTAYRLQQLEAKVDGLLGPKTLVALPTLRKGNYDVLVRLLQGLLYYRPQGAG